MLSLDRFLSCPSLVRGRRTGRTGLDCRDVDERLGNMAVSPVRKDGSVAESKETGVEIADGDMAGPASAFNGAESHIDGCCAEDPAKKGWSTGLAVCAE